ncbi:MAG: quinone-dependent dihydroorotate dehydrogenase, partial [Flavisolibacter sp.]
MYKIIRKILFFLPAETAHYFSMNLLKTLCSIGFIRKIITKIFSCQSPFTTQLFGLEFRNRVGLGAGFDKNAKYLRELKALGFGFIEIGTVTPRPQAGNDKPRLFRLPEDEALINRMGFNNDGVDVIAGRLKKYQARNKEQGTREEGVSSENHEPKTKSYKLLIGGNIGKNKTTPNEDAWKDYEICFRALHPYVDFFVVNVSSPNTPGLRELQEKDALKKILTHLQQLNQNFAAQKPILLKIAPDLSLPQIDDVIDLASEINLDGLVATNTTISREQLKTPNAKLQTIGAGGLSGKPVKNRSTEIVKYIHQKAPDIPVIGSGGIFTAEDAKEKFQAGAKLIEVWTGFIYEGPFIV